MPQARQPPKITTARAIKPRPALMPSVKLLDCARERFAPATPAKRAPTRTAPTRSPCRLPDRAQAQAEARAAQKERDGRGRQGTGVDEGGLRKETSSQDRKGRKTGQHQVGDGRCGGCTCRKERPDAEACGAQRQQVDRGSDDDLVGAANHREVGEECAEHAGRCGSPEHASRRGVCGDGDREPGERAGQHHSLDPDVENPGALHQELTQRGEQKGRGQTKRGVEKRFHPYAPPSAGPPGKVPRRPPSGMATNTKITSPCTIWVTTEG